jgi:hypothetical protein
MRALKAVSSWGVQVSPTRLVSYCFWATDASRHWGIGGFFDGLPFSVSWNEVRAMKQEKFYPFHCVHCSHINYLELFAFYWALKLWGHVFRRCTLPVWVDNTTALGWLKKLSAPPVYGHCADAIVHMLHIWDIRLLPD